MLHTPAYVFTLLLGIWLLSLVGCIVLGIACYRLLCERRRLRARLEQVALLHSGVQSSTLEGSNRPPDPALPRVPRDAVLDGEATPLTHH